VTGVEGEYTRHVGESHDNEEGDILRGVLYEEKNGFEVG